MLGNNRIYAEFTLIFTLRAIYPDQKLFAGSSSSRQTGVTSRDAVFGVVVRYPFTPCSLLKFLVWMREKSSSSPFGGMLKSSFRQISSYLIAISRKNQARCKPKRRPSQTEPMRNSSSPASSGYSAHTKPSELPQTAISGRQARDLRHKTNTPVPRRGFSHRP